MTLLLLIGSYLFIHLQHYVCVAFSDPLIPFSATSLPPSRPPTLWCYSSFCYFLTYLQRFFTFYNTYCAFCLLILLLARANFFCCTPVIILCLGSADLLSIYVRIYFQSVLSSCCLFFPFLSETPNISFVHMMSLLERWNTWDSILAQVRSIQMKAISSMT